MDCHFIRLDRIGGSLLRVDSYKPRPNGGIDFYVIGKYEVEKYGGVALKDNNWKLTVEFDDTRYESTAKAKRSGTYFYVPPNPTWIQLWGY